MSYTDSQAVAGIAATLTIGGVATAEISDIKGPGLKADMVDVTNNTTSAGEMQSIPGLIDGGEVTFKINLVAGTGGYASLRTLLRARTKSACVLTWAAAKTCSFSGIVTALSPSSPVSGGVTASVTVKISGLPTFAIA